MRLIFQWQDHQESPCGTPASRNGPLQARGSSEFSGNYTQDKRRRQSRGVSAELSTLGTGFGVSVLKDVVLGLHPLIKGNRDSSFQPPASPRCLRLEGGSFQQYAGMWVSPVGGARVAVQNQSRRAYPGFRSWLDGTVGVGRPDAQLGPRVQTLGAPPLCFSSCGFTGIPSWGSKPHKAAMDRDSGAKCSGGNERVCPENRTCKRKERGPEDSAFSRSLVALGLELGQTDQGCLVGGGHKVSERWQGQEDSRQL